MDNKKTNIILIIACIVLSLVTISLGIILFINTKQNIELDNITEEENSNVSEEDVCTREQIEEIISQDMVSNVSLSKGKLLLSGLYTTEDSRLKECTYDFYDVFLQKHSGIDTENNYLGSMIFFGDGNIAYNYANAIYTLNLLNEEDPNLVIDDSIVKDTLWELTGSSFGIYGPYTIGDNANGVTSMPQFLFYTSVEWGCEVGNEDYCDQMTKASNDLEEKNLLGIWIYDSIDKDRRFLTEF